MLTSYATILVIMKLFDFRRKEKKNKITDLYQISLDKFGRDQIKKLVEKGLSIPIVIL